MEAPVRAPVLSLVLEASLPDQSLNGDGTFAPPRRAPFDPKRETITYAGPLAFRRKNVPCLAPDAAAVLLPMGKTWRVLPLRGRTGPPHAFVAWEGGALLIDSQLQPCGWATSSPVEQLIQPTGTVFTQISASGAFSHPTLGLDRDFMAWGGSSAGDRLALVGTYGVRATDAGPPAFGSHDIVVMRRQGAGPFKASLIVKADGPASQSRRAGVREFGAAALLWPPPARDDGTPVVGAPAEGGDELAWKGHASSIFRIADDATTEFRFRSPSEQDCAARDAALVGVQVYAVVACSDGATHVVRADPDGQPDRVELPSTPALGACVPSQLAPAGPHELWVLAACAPAGKPEVRALFRSGPAPSALPAP